MDQDKITTSATTYPHLANAPIIEAVIDIQTKTAQPVTEQNFSQFYELSKSAYPQKQQLMMTQVKIEFDRKQGESFLTGDKHPSGITCRSTDNLQIVQLGQRGITLSRIKPYTEWNHFIGEFENIWDIYKKTCAPTEVTRIGLRYINNYSCAIEEYEQFLTFKLHVGKTRATYFTDEVQHRLLVNDPESQTHGLLTIMIRPAPEQGISVLDIIYDIDVFKDDAIHADINQIKAVLSVLRARKNDLFFSNIGEKARALFSEEKI